MDRHSTVFKISFIALDNSPCDFDTWHQTKVVWNQSDGWRIQTNSPAQHRMTFEISWAGWAGWALFSSWPRTYNSMSLNLSKEISLSCHLNAEETSRFHLSDKSSLLLLALLECASEKIHSDSQMTDTFKHIVCHSNTHVFIWFSVLDKWMPSFALSK